VNQNCPKFFLSITFQSTPVFVRFFGGFFHVLVFVHSAAPAALETKKMYRTMFSTKEFTDANMHKCRTQHRCTHISEAPRNVSRSQILHQLQTRVQKHLANEHPLFCHKPKVYTRPSAASRRTKQGFYCVVNAVPK
jgi:hypothetical protein